LLICVTIIALSFSLSSVIKQSRYYDKATRTLDDYREYLLTKYYPQVIEAERLAQESHDADQLAVSVTVKAQAWEELVSQFKLGAMGLDPAAGNAPGNPGPPLETEQARLQRLERLQKGTREQHPHYRLGFVPDDLKPHTPLTSLFVHESYMRLIIDLIFLYLVGLELEAILGSLLYLGCFVGGGLAAELLFAVMSPNGTEPLTGMSGAVGALLGAFFILDRRARFKFYWVHLFLLKPKSGVAFARIRLAVPLGIALHGLAASLTGGSAAWIVFLGVAGSFFFSMVIAAVIKRAAPGWLMYDSDTITYTVVETNAETMPDGAPIPNVKLLVKEFEDAITHGHDQKTTELMAQISYLAHRPATRDEMIGRLDELLHRRPSLKLDQDLQFMIIQDLTNRDDNKRAMDLLQQLTNADQPRDVQAQALFRQARLLEKMNKKAKAVRILSFLAVEYDGTSWATRARKDVEAARAAGETAGSEFGI